ncbi:MAG: right-handed parallel beta-helix repeat-containing protein, partial [Clostridia bacterium]|nr:right-handed parallel beta-helix repeat-containing protein [Clostridia bacterium]
YVFSSVDTFPNMVLRGSGEKKTILIATPKTKKMLNINSGGNVQVDNIEFRMAAAPKYSATFYFDTAASYVENVYVTNCDFYDAYNAFTDARADNVMMFMHFEDINCYDARSSTFDIQDFEGFIFMKRLNIDNSNSYAKHGVEPFAAIKIDDVRGTIFEEMTVTGANTGSEDEIGFHLPSRVANMASVWWDRVTIKNMGGYGVLMGGTKACVLCSVIDTQILHCGGGICAEGINELQVDRVTIDGNKESVLGLDGISLKNTVYTHLLHVVSKNNSGNGLSLISSKYNTAADCTFTGNGDRGFIARGGAYNELISSTCTDNANGQVSLGEENSLVDQVVYRADGTKGSLTENGRFD